MKTIITNQNISLRNKFPLRYFLLLLILSVSVNGVFAQQVIGHYPSQDGGFEGQTAGTLTTEVNSKSWRLINADLTGAIVETGGRSGDKYANISYKSPGKFLHLLGPSLTNIQAGTHTIQFYYKGDKNDDNDGTYATIRGGIRGGKVDGGANSTNIYVGKNQNNVNNTDWTLYRATFAVEVASKNGLAAVQFNELEGKAAHFDIDDVVIYLGSIDDTPPNSPGKVTVSNPAKSSLDVSWGDASGGVDGGGGYVVVRYAASPKKNNNPNKHGIYAVGNTIVNGTGSLTGTVRYIGTDTSFTDNVSLSSLTTYYYKVYTADKAFNYSSAAEASGTTK